MISKSEMDLIYGLVSGLPTVFVIENLCAASQELACRFDPEIILIQREQIKIEKPGKGAVWRIDYFKRESLPRINVWIAACSLELQIRARRQIGLL
jgi:hypothetical protein